MDNDIWVKVMCMTCCKKIIIIKGGLKLSQRVILECESIATRVDDVKLIDKMLWFYKKLWIWVV